MKKISAEFILMTLCGTLGSISTLAGIVYLIALIFTPLPVFNGFVLFVVGVTLMCVVRVYYTLILVLNKFSDTIDAITKYNDKTSKIENSPQIFPGMSHNIIAHEIKIDDTTSPEEIDDIKKTFPMFADSIEQILKRENLSPLPKTIELLSLTQLERELKKAVSEDNFERATEIRNEINKRTQKK